MTLSAPFHILARALSCATLALLVWASLPSTPASATTYTHTFCIKLRTGFLDAATGDYGTNNPGSWIARGVKFNVYGATYFAGEGGGCATFTATSKAQTGITIYAEARLGGSSNIMVRAFPSLTSQSWWQVFQTDAWLSKWVVQVLPSCSGTTCTATVTNTSDSTDIVSNMLAAVVFGIYQIDNNTSPRLSGSRDLFIHNSGCDEVDDVSCFSSDPLNTLEIQPTWDGARRKFLVGHELGHWFHAQWTNDTTPLDAGDEAYWIQGAPDPDCRSTGVPGGHALRSLEYEVGAVFEGLAHFLSTLAFNDYNETNGMFQYYKDVLTYEFDIVDVEQGTSGGANNWFANGCGCPGNCTWDEDAGGVVGIVTPDEIGSELDWLRAFWDFRTNASPGTKPTHWDIFDILADTEAVGWGLTNTHDQMEGVVPAAFDDRWDEVMDANGADNTPE